MDRDDVERMVRVEEGLRELKADLREHSDEDRSRHDELRAMFLALSQKIDDNAFRWSRVISPDAAKVVMKVLVGVAAGGGIAGVVKALFE